MDEFDYQDYILLYDRLRCDGVIFNQDAFRDSFQRIVPIVHGLEFNECLGMATLENDTLGVVAKCKFFDTDMGNVAKFALISSDELTLSCPIYRVKRDGKDVISGDIRCVSVIAKGSALTYTGNQKD